jgi:ABC-type glycerol-3-phosphate transport system permease component
MRPGGLHLGQHARYGRSRRWLILRAFMLTLPRSIVEAARVDGPR